MKIQNIIITIIILIFLIFFIVLINSAKNNISINGLSGKGTISNKNTGANQKKVNLKNHNQNISSQNNKKEYNNEQTSQNIESSSQIDGEVEIIGEEKEINYFLIAIICLSFATILTIFLLVFFTIYFYLKRKNKYKINET